MPGVVGILILIVVGLMAVRTLFLRTQDRVSVVIPILAGLLMFAWWGERIDSDSAREEIRLAITGIDEPALPGAETDSGSATKSEAESGTEPESGENVPLRIEETRYGNMLVLPLSSAALNEYLGTEGANALDHISGVVPDELRQAYALVPIVGPVGDALPGLRALAQAVTNLVELNRNAGPSRRPAEAPTDGAPQQPAWLTRPGENQTVLTAFDEPGQPLAAVLKDKVTATVLAEARNLLGNQYPIPNAWQPRRQLQLSDESVLQCVAEHYHETIPIRAGNTTETMQSTSALIAIPDSVRDQAVTYLRETAQHQRTWTVGAAAICLGLLVMLAAGLVQLLGAPKRLSRLVGIPLLLLVMLPCLGASGALLQDIAHHRSAPLPQALELPGAVIDVTAGSDGVAERSSEDLAAE